MAFLVEIHNNGKVKTVIFKNCFKIYMFHLFIYIKMRPSDSLHDDAQFCFVDLINNSSSTSRFFCPLLSIISLYHYPFSISLSLTFLLFVSHILFFYLSLFSLSPCCLTPLDCNDLIINLFLMVVIIVF